MYSSKLRIVHYSRNFLDLSWNWLNDPEIKQLTGTPDFTKKQQEDFFLSLPKENYLVWGVMYENTAIGVVGLKNINGQSAEYFGYIGEKDFWGRGLFSYILKLIVEQCIKIKISYIYLRVCVDNHMAIKAYKKNGFEIEPEKCNSQQRFM